MRIGALTALFHNPRLLLELLFLLLWPRLERHLPPTPYLFIYLWEGTQSALTLNAQELLILSRKKTTPSSSSSSRRNLQRSEKSLGGKKGLWTQKWLTYFSYKSNAYKKRGLFALKNWVWTLSLSIRLKVHASAHFFGWERMQLHHQPLVGCHQGSSCANKTLGKILFLGPMLRQMIIRQVSRRFPPWWIMKGGLKG